MRRIFSPYDGEWHSFREILDNGADPRFIVSTCAGCRKE